MDWPTNQFIAPITPSTNQRAHLHGDVELLLDDRGVRSEGEDGGFLAELWLSSDGGVLLDREERFSVGTIMDQLVASSWSWSPNVTKRYLNLTDLVQPGSHDVLLSLEDGGQDEGLASVIPGEGERSKGQGVKG